MLDIFGMYDIYLIFLVMETLISKKEALQISLVSIVSPLPFGPGAVMKFYGYFSKLREKEHPSLTI